MDAAVITYFLYLRFLKKKNNDDNNMKLCTIKYSNVKLQTI